MSDARQFSAEVTDDDSLRQFMVNYGYSESYEEAAITDEEVASFRGFTQPRLEQMAYTQPDFEQWKQVNLTSEIEDSSTFDLMIESLGLFDLIFVVLGVGTAFRLGSGEEVA